MGKPEAKRSLGRPRLRWKDNIKIDLQDVGCGILDWIAVDQGQVVGSCECSNEHSVSIKCGEFLDYLRNCQLLDKGSAPMYLVTLNTKYRHPFHKSQRLQWLLWF